MDIDSIETAYNPRTPSMLQRYILSKSRYLLKGTFARDLRDPSTPSIFHTCQVMLAYQFRKHQRTPQKDDAHGKHNSTAQDQSGQSGHGSGPESEDTLVLEDSGCADKAVLVVLAGFKRLHSR